MTEGIRVRFSYDEKMGVGTGSIMMLVSGGSDTQEGGKLEESQEKRPRRNKFALSVVSCIIRALNPDPQRDSLIWLQAAHNCWKWFGSN